MNLHESNQRDFEKSPEFKWYLRKTKLRREHGAFFSQDSVSGVALPGEREYFYASYLWYIRAKAVRYMDNRTCQKCGARGEELDVHHSYPIQKATSENLHRNFDPEFLVTLCRECHEEFHEDHVQVRGVFHPVRENVGWSLPWTRSERILIRIKEKQSRIDDLEFALEGRPRTIESLRGDIKGLNQTIDLGAQ